MVTDQDYWDETQKQLETKDAEIAELRAEIERCNKHFKTINDTIFGEGLALGSEKYFLVRGLCCQYLTSKTLKNDTQEQ